jgi:hypothetical protein
VTMSPWLLALWSRRQWLFTAYLILAIARIPMRTGFRFVPPVCDLHPSLANAALSLTKLPHVVLFGLFFMLTVMQFSRLDRATVMWSIFATVALGALVELEEGATRTGNCRMTDLLPDLVGALIGAVLIMLMVMGGREIRHRMGTRPTTS